MRRRVNNLLRILFLVLVLYILGAVALDTYASVITDAADRASCASTTAGACYTIDTSRPEWSTQRVYLPLVLRN